MTKKDYIKLAKLIKDTIVTENLMVTNPNDFIAELCDILKEDNPRFDKERFTTACKS